LFRILLINILLISLAQAQTTIIYGKVTDASSNEPIMFCNVFFEGAGIGTTTDFEGNYKIETQHPLDSLTVQALGYSSRKRKIIKEKEQKIDFQLEPSNIALEEIVIVPGENPAFRILRGVWKHKKEYNPDKIKTYKYESYAKVEVALNNISDKFRASKTMRPYVAIFDSLQKKAGKDGKVVLPMITSETVNDYYYQKLPKLEKEYTKASKSKALINVTDFLQPFLGTSQHKYNFYNNWVTIFNKGFTSPIATTGRLYYRYYLIDSVKVDGVECYLMQFKPKRKGDLAFNGKMWITKDGFILKKIKADVGKTANFNFVDRFKIEQSLEFIDSTTVFPVKNRILVDASRFTSNYGILAKYNLAYQYIELNPELPANTFIRKQEFAQDMNEQTENYWDNKRLELVGDSTIADQSYMVIDSLSQSKSIKRISNTIDFITEGYLPTKYFEFGHYMFFLGYNDDEGFRTQIGGRTTAEFSKNWILSGHVAYGFLDEKFKYDMQVERFLSRKFWTKIGASYKYDLDRVGVNSNYISQNPLMSFSLALSSQFGGTQYASLGDDFNLWLRSDLGRGFQGKINLRHYYFNPYNNYAFAYYDKNNQMQGNYILSDITTTIRYAKEEMFIHRKNDRVGVNGLKGNVYIFTYTAGLKDVLGSTFSYHKLSLNVRRKIKLGGFGRMQYSLTANKVFGLVPPTLLNILQGNESFFISFKGYNQMDFFEFVADQSAELMLFHHFDGIILNKIPLLRALKWRLTSGFNGAWGTFQQKYEDMIPDTDLKGRPISQFTRLEANMPYLEASAGVENIFKFFSVQYIRRLTYIQEGQNPNAIKFAVMVAF